MTRTVEAASRTVAVPQTASDAGRALGSPGAQPSPAKTQTPRPPAPKQAVEASRLRGP